MRFDFEWIQIFSISFLIHSELWQIRKRRQNWEDELARLYFEAHMRFANGLINIIISHTPPKFLKIMNFLGYKGSESIGLNEMNKVAFEMNAGFMSKIAQLALIYYWVYGKPHGENVPSDLSLCKQMIEAELKIYPKVCLSTTNVFDGILLKRLVLLR